jgi:hypothetical protein
MGRPTHRDRAVWWAAIQREWHRRRALWLHRMSEAHIRELSRLRDRAAHHEQRAKHFQLQEIRLREKLPPEF